MAYDDKKTNTDKLITAVKEAGGSRHSFKAELAKEPDEDKQQGKKGK